ncbi:DUF7144 family membrane protein [Couchioplanes azureus]|uniref:DUF7144 family membrane protein n=1 Tax=Couchioplanes caeruleus TaxID=56438 RepID=UPI0016706F3F|nr:hypothetical protein [Couchioplanes caeruleus]GGQ48809.1 hypothetical protein GCM10010166_16390 [Couchioplanes caeruleus subsp. azureus]
MSAEGAPYAGVEHSEATAWVAVVLLGGVMLVLLGAVHAGTGVVALLRPEALAGGRADLLLPVGLTALAWWHLVIGAVAATAGVGLIRGLRWARVTAILLAGAAALVNFAFVAVHPVWSVTAIAMTVIVIYAVAAHGAEVAGAYGRT